MCLHSSLCGHVCAGGLTAFPPSLCLMFSLKKRKISGQTYTFVSLCKSLAVLDKEHRQMYANDTQMTLLKCPLCVVYAAIFWECVEFIRTVFLPIFHSLFFFCMCERVFCFLAHDSNLVVTRRHPCHPPSRHAHCSLAL